MKKVISLTTSAICLLAACTLLLKNSAPPLGSEFVFSPPDKKSVGSLTWSPTGKELAFTAFDPWTGDNEIYIVDLNKSEARILINQTGVKVQSWAPNGKDIAYNHYREIWLISTDGSTTPDLLTSGQIAAFSPNGGQMAIFENVGTGDLNTYILKILYLETGVEKTLLSIDVGNQEIFDLSWSPDNTRLAFSLPSEKPDGKNNRQDIYVFNIETEELSQFTLTGENYLPTWSPNGRQIAYVYRSSSAGPSTIVISRVDGNCKVVMPGIYDVGYISWSPEGSYLAYTQHTGIYLLDLAIVFGEDFQTTGPKCP